MQQQHSIIRIIQNHSKSQIITDHRFRRCQIDRERAPAEQQQEQVKTYYAHKLLHNIICDFDIASYRRSSVLCSTLLSIFLCISTTTNTKHWWCVICNYEQVVFSIYYHQCCCIKFYLNNTSSSSSYYQFSKNILSKTTSILVNIILIT